MTISPEFLHNAFKREGVDFFVGVPDSVLKEFCKLFDVVEEDGKHIIAVNEGAAVAIAAGHHLATGEVPLVYLQNSGLGNAINPLVSLVDPSVYAVPMVLLVGWRGKPGEEDEPQHIKQGEVTSALLKVLEIPHLELPDEKADVRDAVCWAVNEARTRSNGLGGPVALMVRKGFFEPCPLKPAKCPELSNLNREDAIKVLIEVLEPNRPVVASTGMISREFYECRQRYKGAYPCDFLNIGAMGHTSQIALGLALAFSGETTADFVCVDGDGSALMHMGGMATIGTVGCQSKPVNLLHIVLNNGAHDSVGGQPTAAREIKLSQVARACGYSHVHDPVSDEKALREALECVVPLPGRRFLEVLVSKGARSNLGRPDLSTLQLKNRFTSRLNSKVALKRIELDTT